jgi:hypothetical protein
MEELRREALEELGRGTSVSSRSSSQSSRYQCIFDAAGGIGSGCNLTINSDVFRAINSSEAREHCVLRAAVSSERFCSVKKL